MSACPSGKVCYRRVDATKALVSIRLRRRRNRRRESKIYECGACGNWHLASG